MNINYYYPIKKRNLLIFIYLFFGILTLHGCAIVAPNFDIKRGQYKNDLVYSRDENYCLRVAHEDSNRYLKRRDFEVIRERIYVSCMAEQGNYVSLKNNASQEAVAWVEEARRQAELEEARRQAELEEARRQAEQRQAEQRQAEQRQAEQRQAEQRQAEQRQAEQRQAEQRQAELPIAASRFANILRTCQMLIFKAAHPLGKPDEINIQLIQTDLGNATFTENVAWSFGNRNYETKIKFNVSYGVQDLINYVTIEATDTNNPGSPAFFGAEAAKYAALHLLADRLKDEKNRYASVFVKTLNSTTSVVGFISEILKIMANDKSSDGCRNWFQA